jgi:hypothetical protein
MLVQTLIGKPPWRVACRFDARKVLEVHGSDLDVGTVDLSAIHLSQRGVFDEGGYYHCVVKADM